MSWSASTSRRTLYFIATVFLGAGLPFGQGCGKCPEFDPEPVYRIITDQPTWVQGSGRVQVTDEAFLISYTTIDGSKWEVEYLRTADF